MARQIRKFGEESEHGVFENPASLVHVINAHELASQPIWDGENPLPAELVQMAMAFWTSRILYVAAKLRLVDHLSKGRKSADALAGPTGTHAPSLYRVMRTLASLGILTEDKTHEFALTPLGEALKSGAPGSAHATILTLAGTGVARMGADALFS